MKVAFYFWFYRIDGLAVLAAPIDDENPKSTCHGMSLHSIENGHNTW